MDILFRYGSPARSFDWGFPGAYPAPGGQGQGQPMHGHGGQQPSGPANGDNFEAMRI